MSSMIARDVPILFGAALLAVATAALTWPTAGSGAEAAEQVALGRDLYATHCASCHGGNLEGQPNWQAPLPDGRMPAPPLDATGHAPHHGDPQLFRVVKEGMEAVSPGRPSDMPAFAGVLSDDEIRAIIAFLKTSW
jgi:mono/diheme cytochrome c family protein